MAKNKIVIKHTSPKKTGKKIKAVKKNGLRKKNGSKETIIGFIYATKKSGIKAGSRRPCNNSLCNSLKIQLEAACTARGWGSGQPILVYDPATGDICDCFCGEDSYCGEQDCTKKINGVRTACKVDSLPPGALVLLCDRKGNCCFCYCP